MWFFRKSNYFQFWATTYAFPLNREKTFTHIAVHTHSTPLYRHVHLPHPTHKYIQNYTTAMVTDTKDTRNLQLSYPNENKIIYKMRIRLHTHFVQEHPGLWIRHNKHWILCMSTVGRGVRRHQQQMLSDWIYCRRSSQALPLWHPLNCLLAGKTTPMNSNFSCWKVCINKGWIDN